MAVTKVRVPGGGNTFIEMAFGSDQTTRVQFLARFNDTPGTAAGTVTPIHPIGYGYPIEIAAPYAQNMGTITLTVWARWGMDGWTSALKTTGLLDGYTSNHGHGGAEGNTYPVDLYEVLEAQRRKSNYVSVHKVELGGDGNVARIKSYQGAVITNISQPEDITVTTMTVQTTITINYCYVTVTYDANATFHAAEDYYNLDAGITADRGLISQSGSMNQTGNQSLWI